MKEIAVLVVDDNSTNLTILEKMLRAWGMQPTLADGAFAAMRELDRADAAKKPFHLILLDVCMPEMDGFTLCEQIRQRAGMANVTIMILSSATRREDALRCRELGVAAYLTKPIGHNELRNTLASVVVGRAEAIALAPQGTPAPGPKVRAPKVLLAEDNEVNQLLVVTLLQKRGHQVTVANNGREAVAALGKQTFDLILMDVQMPVMGGFEATAAIRSLEKVTGTHIPIIALTAHTMKGDQIKCLEAGMDAYVPKPLQIKALMLAIEGLTKTLPAMPSVETPQETLPAASIINMEELIEQMDGDSSLLKRMASLFLVDAPKRMEGIRDALETGNVESLRKLSHALKGSAANFFAAPVAEAAAHMESLARQSDLANAPEAFQDLKRQVDQLSSALETLAATGDLTAAQ